MTTAPEIETEDPNALFRAAVELHRAGRLAEAVGYYERALSAEPRHVFARGNLGAALRSLGRNDDALASYDAAIALKPDYADAHNNRGNLLLDLGRPEAALESFETAVALAPENGAFHNNRGNALLSLARPKEALESFDAAIRLKPDHAMAHFNRGGALRALGATEAAVAAYDAALALQPGYFKARINRADALFELKRFDDAIAGLDAAIALKPDDPGARYNRGNVLLEQGKTEAAIADFEAALALDPGHEDAWWNRSIAFLKLGRFAEGWADYDRRWTRSAFVTRSAGQVTPELRGRLALNPRLEDLTGRRILVVAEEAIGDVVMFASMLPDLLETSPHMSLLCESRLQRLFAASFPGITLLDPGVRNVAEGEFDVVLAIGSLGRLYRNRAEDFPGRPYLAPRQAVRDRWAERLGPKPARLRVGLSWRGGTAVTGGSARSMALGDLAPLLRLPDCEFVSLQYGDPRAEIEAANAGLTRPIRRFEPGEIEDFEDLAGLVTTLDAVVSVQTAVVHLAGAVGAPCLTLIPRITSWKYGESSLAMPWYGSVRLFRQNEDRAWPPVIGRIAEALGETGPGGRGR